MAWAAGAILSWPLSVWLVSALGSAMGLPLIKPPWGRITAIDLNTGEHVWMVPNGQAPEYVRKHPALAGIDLSGAGNPERAPLLVTKTLLFSGDGAGLFSSGPQGGGRKFAEAKERVIADLRKLKEEEAYERWLDGLKERATIRL